MRFALLLSVLLLAIQSPAAANECKEVSATIRDLVPSSQLLTLAKTFRVDQPIHWKLCAPNKSQPPGVLVFVSARDSGDVPAQWIPVLNERNLSWIAATDFGNRKPTAQRVLAALMGLAYVQREFTTDAARVYVAGMSGGGRVASKVITKFPHLFTGAIYIVGADSWDSTEAHLLPAIAKNNYVFITGSNDFNRREIRAVFEQYQSAGVSRSQLMDLPNFGHQLPNANQLRNALIFLDGQ